MTNLPSCCGENKVSELEYTSTAPGGRESGDSEPLGLERRRCGSRWAPSEVATVSYLRMVGPESAGHGARGRGPSATVTAHPPAIESSGLPRRLGWLRASRGHLRAGGPGPGPRTAPRAGLLSESRLPRPGEPVVMNDASQKKPRADGRVPRTHGHRRLSDTTEPVGRAPSSSGSGSESLQGTSNAVAGTTPALPLETAGH